MEDSALLLLKKTLRKVPKQQLIVVLLKWGNLPVGKVNFKMVKYDIIHQICCLAKKKNVSIADALRLNLLWLIINPHQRIWKAYKMIGQQKKQSELNYNCSTFEKCLKQQLFPSFSCDAVIEEENNVFWGCVSFSSTKQLYFMYYPLSCLLFCSNVKLKQFSRISDAIAFVVGFKKAKSLMLESNDPNSLAQSIFPNDDTRILKKNQENNPKTRIESEKFPWDDRILVQKSESQRMLDKDIEIKLENEVQPVIHFINIISTTKIRGTTFLPEIDPGAIISCQTRFVGPNVLEGLKAMAKQSLIKKRIPSFLVSKSQHLRLRDPSVTN